MKRIIIIVSVVFIIGGLALGTLTVGARQYTYSNLYSELEKFGAEKKYDDQGLFISNETLVQMEKELEIAQKEQIIALKKQAIALGLKPESIIDGVSSRTEQITLLENAIATAPRTPAKVVPETHDANDDNGVDDPTTHDANDDNGVDDPATHDANDDNGVDDPATHDANDDNGVDDPTTHDANDDSGKGSDDSGKGSDD